MAKITASLSTKVDERKKSEILLRFVGGADHIYRLHSRLYVPASRWKDGDIVIPRLETDEQKELRAIDTRLKEMRQHLLDRFAEVDKMEVTKAWMQDAVDRFLHPDRPDPDAPAFFDAADEYVASQRVSELRHKHYLVIVRALRRWEEYRGRPLKLDTFSKEDIGEFERFLEKEHELVKSRKWKRLYSGMDSKEIPEPRSRNTLLDYLIILRAFFHWARRSGKTKNNPFDGYVIGSAVYGTPYYITIEERDRIYRTNLSRHPALAAQRDIFVFQCLTGPRVGDLLSFKKGDVVDGFLEYIPGKTSGVSARTVRVPLNATAREIVERYADLPGRKLLPFIEAQNYNHAIKRIFLAARVTRPVTILDPMTRREVKRPINEVASSHLARRTFIGNLYKQVKDPNLIGALSGHVEGSAAFARYRSIDDEMKTELVNLLEV